MAACCVLYQFVVAGPGEVLVDVHSWFLFVWASGGRSASVSCWQLHLSQGVPASGITLAVSTAALDLEMARLGVSCGKPGGEHCGVVALSHRGTSAAAA